MAAVLTAMLAAGCGSDPSDVTADDLVGLWGAVSMEFTSHADASVSTDIVASAGATYSIQLFHDRGYTSQLSGPSVPTVVQSGEYAVTDRRLLLTPVNGAVRTLDLSFNQALLTLTEADAAWDFDGDGAAEGATLRMVLDRF